MESPVGKERDNTPSQPLTGKISLRLALVRVDPPLPPVKSGTLIVYLHRSRWCPY